MHDGRLKIAVTAPAVDGAANAAVLETLARALGVAKRNLTVISGQTSRRKTVCVQGMNAQALSDWLAQVTAP